MLKNKFSFKLFINYKYAYLKNFSGETTESFDYFVNNYLTKTKIYLSGDENDDLELGLMLIPKNVIVKNKLINAFLIYGLVAGDKYKGTKVLNRLFPSFIEMLKNKENLILIESEHWKIYDNFSFKSLNEFLIMKKFKKFLNLSSFQVKNNFDKNFITNFLKIYRNHIKNWKIVNYVTYDLHSLQHVLTVNQKMGDQLLFINDAYAFYTPNENKVYGFIFESKKAFFNLIKCLPDNSIIQLDKIFTPLVMDNLSIVSTFCKTKLVFSKNKIDTLFFNEVN